MTTQQTWLPAGGTTRRTRLSTLGHHLRPIRAADTDLDMVAVMGSRERLCSIYGTAWGWPPATMTVEQDREDLQRHADEIERHESFNYALFDEAETVLLGCVYVDPPTRAARTPRSPGGSSTPASAPTSRPRSTSSSRAGSPRTGRSSAPRYVGR